MRKMKAKMWMAVALGLSVMVLASGCTSLKGKQISSSPTAANQKTKPANAPVYYDFGDILLPKELKVDKGESFVFNTPSLTAGVLTLTGRVDVSSLTNFFENKMAADGWYLISPIKSPRSKMLFKKESRWCVISIRGGQLSTVVEVWVAPTMAGGELGLTK
jgi:hypothetical protein